MAMRENLLVFALGPSEVLGRAVAADYGIEIAPHELRRFDDGEHKIRPLVSVRGRDVYILGSLYGAVFQVHLEQSVGGVPTGGYTFVIVIAKPE